MAKTSKASKATLFGGTAKVSLVIEHEGKKHSYTCSPMMNGKNQRKSKSGNFLYWQIDSDGEVFGNPCLRVKA